LLIGNRIPENPAPGRFSDAPDGSHSCPENEFADAVTMDQGCAKAFQTSLLHQARFLPVKTV